MGNLVRALTRDGGISIFTVDSTNIISDMEKIHKTSATASAALGRTLTAACLMSCALKNKNDSLTLRIKGNGPIGSIIAVGDYLGNVKGTCDNCFADLPLNNITGKLDVAGVVGKEGIVTVIKDLGLKEPYIGQIEITSGEISEDITAYYAVSEQIPTACALGVLVNPDLTIKAAGGFILQLLPGVSEPEINIVEKNIAGIASVTSMLDQGLSAKEIAVGVMDGFELDILDEYDVEYRCGCSLERMTNVIMSLGRKEIEDMIDSGEETEIVCNFCNKKYVFSPEQLTQLLK